MNWFRAALAVLFRPRRRARIVCVTCGGEWRRGHTCGGTR